MSLDNKLLNDKEGNFISRNLNYVRDNSKKAGFIGATIIGSALAIIPWQSNALAGQNQQQEMQCTNHQSDYGTVSNLNNCHWVELRVGRGGNYDNLMVGLRGKKKTMPQAVEAGWLRDSNLWYYDLGWKNISALGDKTHLFPGEKVSVFSCYDKIRLFMKK